MYLSENAGSEGTYKLLGGTLQVNGNIVNTSGTGTLILDGGTLDFRGTSLEADTVKLGDDTGNYGYLTLDNKTMATQSLYIGDKGAGNLILQGGEYSADNMYIATTSGSTGSFTLNGGTLLGNGVVSFGAGTPSFTMRSGGVLKINGTMSSSAPLTIDFQSGTITGSTTYTISIS